MIQTCFAERAANGLAPRRKNALANLRVAGAGHAYLTGTRRRWRCDVVSA
jgi:hypothetical protein